jgi:uncharacterized protein (DUF362 family)/Pyruvate/2-oxoacid:ferredoxin oxidoreductase delta subunit
MNRVFIARCQQYEQTKLEQVVSSLLKGLGAAELKGKKVLLKPNLSGYFHPEKGVTTHPLFVKVVAESFLSFGCEVWIGDSSIDVFRDTEKLYEITGMKDIAEKLPVRLINFEECGAEILPNSSGGVIAISKVIKEADAIINLPKMKTHALTYISGAIKNLWGCQPGRVKVKAHREYPKIEDFVRIIVDVLEAVKPWGALMDAIEGMEGDGPTGGRKRSVGLALASRSSVALDMIASSIMDFNPLTIPLIKEAVRRGLGPSKIENIDIMGVSLDDVKISGFAHPSTFRHTMERGTMRFLSPLQKIFDVRPKIEEDVCVACKKCEEGCPTKAINISPERKTIEYVRCIRCFCCHEICPQGAMKLEKTLIKRLIG